jgi:hypothetical protein
MAEQNYKLKVITEILDLSKVPSLNARQKKFLKNFANDLVKKDESEIRKSIYATFRQGGARGGEIRGLLPVLPESSELRKTALGKKPEYKKGGKEKLVEMFADEGGANVLDQRKEEFWINNPNLDDAKIEAIAKANGLTKQELYKRLQDETTKETRRQIAEGETTGDLSEKIGALALGLAFPRGIEAVREGRDLTAKDIGLDIGENLMYTMNPATKAGQLGLRALGKFAPKAAEKAGAIGSKVAGAGLKNFTLGTGLNAFANPILFETADAILYDQGPRANFNTTDVIAGGVTNLVVPTFIRSQLMRAGRIGGVKGGRTDTKALETAFGESEEKVLPTFKEFKSDLSKKMARKKALTIRAENRGGVGNVEANLKPAELKEYQSINPIYEIGTELNEAAEGIAKIAGREGVSLAKATKKYFAKLPKEKRNSIQLANREMGEAAPFTFVKDEFAPTNNLLNAIKNSDWAPVLEETAFMTPELKRAAEKSATRQMLLGGAVNLASNKYGDTEQGGLLRLFPFYDVEEKRKAEEEERQKEEEKAEMQGYIFPFESEESEGL